MAPARVWLLGLLVAVVAGASASAQPAARPATASLERFFHHARSFRAQFRQVVLDGSFNTVQQSSGTLWIERPDKFRWNYDTPYAQQIVADGKDLWVYDVDLQQVTVRPLSGGLGDTPAMLLAGRGRLQDRFTIKDLGTQGALQWVELVPKRRNGGFVDTRIGFEGGELRVLEMLDSLGQTTRVTLQGARENVRIDPARFTFTLPPGVDVVGHP